MSFSSDAKSELCRDKLTRRCCALAEASGVLLYCNSVSMDQIKIVTESADFAARLPQLFRKAFKLSFDEVQEGTKYTFLLQSREKNAHIFETIGYSPAESISLHVNYGLLEKDCCRVSFLRGAFLSGGSVTDPTKRYHLELATNHHKVSRETNSLLLDLGFQPKDTLRNGCSILYFKQSDAIEEFLAKLGAPLASLLCYTVSMVPNLYYVSKYSGLKLSPGELLFRPGLATAAMALCVWGMKRLIGFDRLCRSLPAVMLTIVIAAGVYVIAAGLTHAIHRDDLPARVRKWLRIP